MGEHTARYSLFIVLWVYAEFTGPIPAKSIAIFMAGFAVVDLLSVVYKMVRA